jgi:hypothetical protein
MLFGFGLFNIYHPGRVLVGPESSFPKRTKAEKREEKQRKKEEKQRKKEEKQMRKKGFQTPSSIESDRIEMLGRAERGTI